MFCEAATSLKPITFCNCNATHRVKRDGPDGASDMGGYCDTHAESVRAANSWYALKAYIVPNA